MFDFAETLNDGDQALAKSDFALAMFYYWLVNFAYEDEEFPYYYSPEIGQKASKQFMKLLSKHKDDLLESESYIKLKESMSIFETYRKYFKHFEREIRNYQK